MPFKLWDAFENVGAIEFQELIQEQVVARFPDAIERDDELESVGIEGQLSTLEAERRLDVSLGDDDHVPLATWGPHDTTWIPTVDATTTAPTLGTGNDRFARVHNAGTMIRVQLRIAFGGSGVDEGDGFYFIDLPHNAVEELHTTRECIIGRGLAYDASTPGWFPVYAVCVGANQVRFRVEGADDFVGHDQPWTWDVNDVLFDGSIEYERVEP